MEGVTKQSRYCLLTYLLTSWSRVLLEKLTGLQLVKKFPAFYGTRRFIIAFTVSATRLLSQLNPVHTPTSHFLKIHLNIFLPSTPGSPQCSLPQISPPKPCIRFSPPHPNYMLSPSYSSHFYHPHGSGCGIQIMELFRCCSLQF
jgi:hypothetical protein